MGFKLPTLRDITNAASDAYTEYIRGLGTGLVDVIGDAVDLIPGTRDLYDNIRGADTDADKEVKFAEYDKREAEKRQRERIDAYNDALGARDIDETTRAEIQNLFNSGADAAEIGRLLGASREGKGIFAVRRVNDARKKYLAEFPGRDGSVLSLGRGTVLGGGRGY